MPAGLQVNGKAGLRLLVRARTGVGRLCKSSAALTMARRLDESSARTGCHEHGTAGGDTIGVLVDADSLRLR